MGDVADEVVTRTGRTGLSLFSIIVGLATSSSKEGLGRSSVLVNNQECCSEVERPGKTAVEYAHH